MTMATFGHGTLLQIGDGAVSQMFTTIGNVMNISGPSLALETIDTTSHDTADKFREFIGGLRDAGEVSFSVNFLPSHATQSSTSGLIKDLEDATLRDFQIVFPFTAVVTWAITALVTGYTPTAPIDDKMTADVTLKVSGKPTLS